MPAASSNPKGLLTLAQVGQDYCDQLFAVEKKLAVQKHRKRSQSQCCDLQSDRNSWCQWSFCAGIPTVQSSCHGLPPASLKTDALERLHAKLF